MYTPKPETQNPKLLESAALLGLGPVPLVEAGGRKLADLVTDHVLADEYRYVSAAIMDADGVAHHVRGEGAGARPRS